MEQQLHLIAAALLLGFATVGSGVGNGVLFSKAKAVPTTFIYRVSSDWHKLGETKNIMEGQTRIFLLQGSDLNDGGYCIELANLCGIQALLKQKQARMARVKSDRFGRALCEGSHCASSAQPRVNATNRCGSTVP